MCPESLWTAKKKKKNPEVVFPSFLGRHQRLSPVIIVYRTETTPAAIMSLSTAHSQINTFHNQNNGSQKDFFVPTRNRPKERRSHSPPAPKNSSCSWKFFNISQLLCYYFFLFCHYSAHTVNSSVSVANKTHESLESWTHSRGHIIVMSCCLSVTLCQVSRKTRSLVLYYLLLFFPQNQIS